MTNIKIIEKYIILKLKIHDEENHKYIKKTEYLVKWLGYKRRTWEPIENLKNCPLILEKYLKRKKESKKDEGINKNNRYNNQLLKLSECQKNNRSYQNFGPSFKEVMEVNAIITEEERLKSMKIDLTII